MTRLTSPRLCGTTGEVVFNDVFARSPVTTCTCRASSIHAPSPYARARLNRNLELSRRINIFVTHDEQKITTLHEVLWMRPRVPPTPPR